MERLRVFGVFFMLAVTVQSIPLVVNSLDSEELQEEDDFTTHTLERLSSAATCLVAGVEYTHGQQIYRADQCEFCLCLDGEMFCWWQDCPPTLEGPCRERGPFSPCLNGVKSRKDLKQTTHKALSTTTKTTTVKELTTATPNVTDVSSNSANATSASTSAELTTKAVPKICVVMGREYKIGDKLPHDTGNCVECVCGAAGQVTCSPNQCAPLGEEINDYRPPGPRTSLADMF